MKKIRPCLECGSTDIKIWDCGYSSFNVGGATCNSCGNKTKLSVCGCFPEGDIITQWNSHNPNLEEAIEKIHLSTKNLKKQIQKNRDKITKLTRIHMNLEYGEKE